MKSRLESAELTELDRHIFIHLLKRGAPHRDWQALVTRSGESDRHDAALMWYARTIARFSALAIELYGNAFRGRTQT